jgi:hypothetical protein
MLARTPLASNSMFFCDWFLVTSWVTENDPNYNVCTSATV